MITFANEYKDNYIITVAEPGFDLRGGAWTLSTKGGGRKSSESVVG